MPIRMNLLERLVLLDFNQGPGLMLDFLGAEAFRALGVAVRLGVFEALSSGPLTAAETSRRVQASERGTLLLLDALEALGYVTRRDGRYANTRLTVKWLQRNSPTSLSLGIPFFESMVFDRWGHLEDSIRMGKPAVYGSEWLDQHPGGYRMYEEGMIAIARMAADEVIARVRLPSAARRLLDVAGGHGLYSIRLCRRYPGLSATVFDLPPALEVAKETIAAEGMTGRVTTLAGDVLRDELGDGFDVVLLFNLIHAFPPATNAQILRKLYRSLNDGGRIVIMEQIPGKLFGSTANVLARLQALNYFNDLEAQTYRFEDIAGWLTQAGFVDPRLLRLQKTPGFGLIQASKPK